VCADVAVVMMAPGSRSPRSLVLPSDSHGENEFRALVDGNRRNELEYVVLDVARVPEDPRIVIPIAEEERTGDE
jgi:hypothetical protein